MPAVLEALCTAAAQKLQGFYPQVAFASIGSGGLVLTDLSQSVCAASIGMARTDIS